MKQTRRILGILLSLLLVLGTVSVGMGALAAEETVLFGTYPQSEVTDTALMGKLADVSKHWKSYNYYSGTGNWTDGKMQPSDFMRYADFAYNGNAYRAVQFTKYRPSYTGAQASATAGNGSGYTTEFIYYFKYEPIEWVVLSKGNGILMSKKLLDAQAYENVVTNSKKLSYANSSIRSFLTNDFYNVAFSDAQKSALGSLTPSTADYNGASGTAVTDKIALLTYKEAIKASGTVLYNATDCKFSTSANSDYNRVANTYTDYARCQGLNISGSTTDWWLLTPSESAAKACFVDTVGAIGHTASANLTNKGVRPIIKLTNRTDNTESAIVSCRHNGGTTAFPQVDATCTKPGHAAYTICNLCSGVASGESTLIPAKGHVDEKMRNGDRGADGWCDVCGEELSIHLDNSGKLQIDGPLQKLFDLIRKIVAKIEEMMGRMKAADSKTTDKAANNNESNQNNQTDDESLSKAGEALNSLGDLLGGVIGAIKGFSDEQSTEKEQNRTEIFDMFKGLLGA